MSFRISISVAKTAAAELEAFIAESGDVELLDKTVLSPSMAISPMSLVEMITFGLAMYSTSFEPIVPLIKRLVAGRKDIVIITRYGSARIKADAPLSQEELLSVLKPLLPKTNADV